MFLRLSAAEQGLRAHKPEKEQIPLAVACVTQALHRRGMGTGRALKRDGDYEFVLLDEKIHAVETPYACESLYVRVTLDAAQYSAEMCSSSSTSKTNSTTKKTKNNQNEKTN